MSEKMQQRLEQQEAASGSTELLERIAAVLCNPELGAPELCTLTRSRYTVTVGVLERLYARYGQLGPCPPRPRTSLTRATQEQIEHRVAVESARRQWQAQTHELAIAAARELVKLADEGDPLASGMISSLRDEAQHHAAWKGSYDGDY